MTTLISFVTDNLQWLIAISVLTLIGLIILVPAVVINMPADYFLADQRHSQTSQHPLIRIIIVLIKNTLGAILVITGLIMLITPGQGLLTLLVGLIIMNYPGKYRLERWMITQLRLLPAINWLRARYHKEVMQIPTKQEERSR